MSDTETVTCTCNCVYHSGHDQACELWSVPAYVAGTKVWFIDRLVDLEELNLVDPTAADVDDLIDMRLTLDEEPECDCGEEPDPNSGEVDHAASCALWYFEPFVEGDCFWDPHSEALVWMDQPVLDTPPLADQDFTKAKPIVTDDWGYGGSADGWWSSGPKHVGCDHANQPLTFVNGVTVFPRALHAKTKADTVPDLGLYLDSGWRPRSLAYFIPWQDHGLPTIPLTAVAGVIVDCFEQAAAGWSLELGCIGAHGRTGTVLACMAILAGTPTNEAAQWVWDNYCTKAIESKDQEWFITWFGAWHHGEIAPPMPPEPPPIVYPKAPLTGSLFDGPLTEGTPVPFDGDLTEGAACPACKSPIEKIKDGLACSKRGCVHYDGLLRCRECERHVDAHPRWDFMCWNTKCKNFHVKEKDRPKKKK